ncbi:MAG: tyrosine recombinase [Firmicutes bacterium]|nr:tyrosine recombinase [Bacillota bacterium]MDD7601808.1 tyrosine recombinase [Bacillota bacterium]MDY5855821.1 tyrosine recombinase [Anaerovoracaceae bacterium]
MREFAEYLKKEKKMADNTVEAYERDVRSFCRFTEKWGLENPEEAANAEVVAYLMHLKQEGKARATVNRKLAAIRTWFQYLVEEGRISRNPALDIKSPKIERKEIEYLSVEEVERLMEVPDHSPKGIRDRAILELLYATGIRASELIALEIDDVNVRMGFVTCDGENMKARIIPIGRPGRKAMEAYLYGIRQDILARHPQERTLFVNYIGKPITRQGLWKILKEYGEKAELSHSLTPQVLRNSFAVHMLQNGADLKSLQELLGHEDISATQIYLSVTKNRIKDVYDKTHPRA